MKSYIHIDNKTSKSRIKEKMTLKLYNYILPLTLGFIIDLKSCKKGIKRTKKFEML